MILQNLDDPALADMAMAAFLDHSPQFTPKGLKLLDPDLHLLEMRPRYGVSSGTACLRSVRQVKQLTNFLDAEPQFAGMADELQALYVIGFIQPMPAL